MTSIDDQKVDTLCLSLKINTLKNSADPDQLASEKQSNRDPKSN